jgi:hypothetical protein
MKPHDGLSDLEAPVGPRRGRLLPSGTDLVLIFVMARALSLVH